MDEEDFDRLGHLGWYYLLVKPGFGYAVRKVGLGGKRQRLVYLHREILGADAAGMWVDHRNGDTLNNRRCNIRLVTPRDNSLNRRCHRARAGAA